MTSSSLSRVSENSPIPVLIPYIVSPAAIFLSTIARQRLIRSSESSEISMLFPLRATSTRSAMRSDDPSSLRAIRHSSGIGVFYALNMHFHPGTNDVPSAGWILA